MTKHIEANVLTNLLDIIDKEQLKKIFSSDPFSFQVLHIIIDPILARMSGKELSLILDHPDLPLLHNIADTITKNKNLTDDQTAAFFYNIDRNKKRMRFKSYPNALAHLGYRIAEIKNRNIMDALSNYQDIVWAVINNKIMPLDRCRDFLTQSVEKFAAKTISIDDLIQIMDKSVERLPKETAEIAARYRTIARKTLDYVSYDADGIRTIWHAHQRCKDLRRYFVWAQETPGDVLEKSWDNKCSNTEQMIEYMEHQSCSDELFCCVWKKFKKTEDADRYAMEARRLNSCKPIPRMVAQEILEKATLEFLNSHYSAFEKSLGKNAIEGYIGAAKLEL